MQKLRFEPILLDGSHTFISFRPETASPTMTLVVGTETKKRDGRVAKKSSDYSYEVIIQGLEFDTHDAYHSNSWLAQSKKNAASGYFGRVRLECAPRKNTARRHGGIVFQFFSASRTVDEEDYIEQRDVIFRSHSNGDRSDDDVVPEYGYRASPERAKQILLDLDENDFYAYVEEQREDESSLYGLSSRWKQMIFAEKNDLLPPFEREIETEIISLMRTTVWSDPEFACSTDLLPVGCRNEKPFWRRPRVCASPGIYRGDLHFLSERFERRINKIWPYIGRRFHSRFKRLKLSRNSPSDF